MANYGINVWDRSGMLGNGSSQRLGQLQWYGTVPAGGSVNIPDVDQLENGVSQMFGVWSTANGGPDDVSRSYLTYSYNAGTRTATITNTSGAPENNVFLVTW